MKTVDELIDHDNHSWDVSLIEDLFNPIDVLRILKIPLNHNMTEDFIAWHLTKSYSFTVKSAYYVQWNSQFGQNYRRHDGLGTSTQNPVWEILWKLRVPLKVKIFGWKALHGMIPGLSILANRHIKTTAQCPVCKLGPEDIKHLMFTCARARQVWTAIGIMDVIDDISTVDRSGSVCFEKMLRRKYPPNPKLDKITVAEAILVGSWYIWWQRRQFVHGESVAPPPQSAFSILGLATNFKGAELVKTPKEVRWQKPMFNAYKLNIDAAFLVNGSGAMGAVLRNHKGEAVAGSGLPLSNLLDATTAEALALQRGFDLIDHIGCSPVIIETDSLEVCKAYNGETEIWGPYSAILADCFLRAQSIGSIQVQHCAREANMVAHHLAKFALESNSAFFWDCDPLALLFRIF